MARLDLDLHEPIRTAADNAMLDRFPTRVEHAVRRFGRPTLAMLDRVEEAPEEHRRKAGRRTRETGPRTPRPR